MATNRERYINNASNENIAKILCVALNVYDNFINCGREDYKELYQVLSQYIYTKYEETFINHSSFNRLGEIEKWLSQEEDKVIKNISSNYEKPEIIQITKEAYNSILERLDKLEKSVKDSEHIDMNYELRKENIIYTKSNQDVTFEKEKTADQMFKDLGYSCEFKTGIKTDYEIEHYIYSFPDNATNDKYIKIYTNGAFFCNEVITQKDYKAIHKKISEMKNKNGGDVKCNVSS